MAIEADGKCFCCSVIGIALGQCQFVVDTDTLWSLIRPHFGGLFMTIWSCVAGKALSQFWKFCWWATQCAITGLGLNSQKSLNTCLLVMVQQSIPFHCIFPYLELHYYNHWSHIKVYIWSTASSLVIIIFTGGSVIHLVIQEIIILWNRQNINSIVNNISEIKSKYFSHEPPAPNQ